MLALAIVWALFVPVADWLAHHDVGSVKGSLHETALDNARGRLLTLGAGLFAAGALVFTARNFTLSREGQVTDRYTKAVEQLGSEKLAVRIGGIYALERVARDSAVDHPTVMEVLAAFIRDPPRELRPGQDPVIDPLIEGRNRERSIPHDVQAAVTVIARRDVTRDVRRIDLSSAYLTGADLTRADLGGADLAGADLTRADLTRADLGGADLTGADLTDAQLDAVHLIGANLTDTHLNAARLASADFTGATLTRTDFTDADLTAVWWPRDAEIPGGWRRVGYDPGQLFRENS